MSFIESRLSRFVWQSPLFVAVGVCHGIRFKETFSLERLHRHLISRMARVCFTLNPADIQVRFTISEESVDRQVEFVSLRENIKSNKSIGIIRGALALHPECRKQPHHQQEISIR